MSTIHHDVDGTVAGLFGAVPAGHALVVVKGALDGLAPRLVGVQRGAEVASISADLRNRKIAAGDRHAAAGMRVLAVAYRTLPHDADELRRPNDAIEHDLVLLGLVGMIDPPRPEVAAAVQRCTAAGIRPVMITGDHPLTAQAIAAHLGIGDGAPAMTGAELDQLDAAGWSDAVQRVSVFARVSPEHKLRLIDALKAQGHVVAMTGDGVNDAPALRRADIGVAMGITGTDVSKEAAAMVLRDDNFSTIVAAVEEGRVIFDNLRRFVTFAVAGNLGKILVMLIWPIPLLLTDNTTEAVALLPLQLLWLNLMTDGLLGLAMGVERAERNVMQRPPNDPESGILSGRYGRQTALIGVAIGAIALAVGFAYHAADRPEWQTMVFTTLAFLQIGQALATRSSTEPIWRLGLRSNPTNRGRHHRHRPHPRRPVHTAQRAARRDRPRHRRPRRLRPRLARARRRHRGRQGPPAPPALTATPGGLLMNCPTCPDERLAIADRHGIEVDYCPACRGIWLDRGELDKLLDRADAGLQQRPDDRHQRSQPISNDDRWYNDEDRYDERGGSRRRRCGMLSDLLDFG